MCHCMSLCVSQSECVRADVCIDACASRFIFSKCQLTDWVLGTRINTPPSPIPSLWKPPRDGGGGGGDVKTNLM